MLNASRDAGESLFPAGYAASRYKLRQTSSGRGCRSGRSELSGKGYVRIGEGYFVVDLHFVEQPVWIALEDLREVNADVAGRLAKAVHDSAEGRFVDAQHSCQAVLPDARGVHPELQVRVNVSIQGHGLALVLYRIAASCGEQQRLSLRNCTAIGLPNPKCLSVNILLRSSSWRIPKNLPYFPKYLSKRSAM